MPEQDADDLNYGLYESFFSDCCVKVIRATNLTCNVTAGIGAPCILPDLYVSDWQKMENFFRTGPIWAIVLVSIGMFIGSMILFYTCFFHGNGIKPPVPYTYVK